MTWGFTAVAGATLVSGYLSSEAIGEAAETTAGATEAGIAAQMQQFQAMQEMLAPYAEAGVGSLEAQQALLGLAGPEAQQAAIQQLESSPQFQALVQQGETGILQSAAATGGLRGGNVQAALAQFRPSVLSQMIQQQFQNLGGITSLGQSSAAMTGGAGMTSASNIGNLLASGAATQAQLGLGQAQIGGQTIGNLAGLFAAYQNRPQPAPGGTL